MMALAMPPSETRVSAPWSPGTARFSWVRGRSGSRAREDLGLLGEGAGFPGVAHAERGWVLCHSCHRLPLSKWLKVTFLSQCWGQSSQIGSEVRAVLLLQVLWGPPAPPGV